MLDEKTLIPDRKDSPLRPVYHASVPSGWGNDPNGLCFFRGAYHMFYQFNPYDTVWGPMHWGHMSSTDLVRWEDLPVALFPDRPFECGGGCFSGSALVRGGLLYVIYTGVGKDSSQQQCMAYSSDGISFVKYDEPVITSLMLPEGAPKDDFRDPKIFEREGTFYCLVGTRIGDKGNIALYRSGDLKSFSLVGMLFPGEGCPVPMEGICECPDIHFFEEGDLLIFSPQYTPAAGGRFQNPQSTVYMSGKIDLATGRFSIYRWDEVDLGSDFYAAQAMDLDSGRCVMIAWKEMWDRSMIASCGNWAGTYTLPRELSLQGGKLLQAPAGEVVGNFECVASFADTPLPRGETRLPGVAGNVIRLKAGIVPPERGICGAEFFSSSRGRVRISYDREKGLLTADRSRQGKAVEGSDADTYVRSAAAPLRDGMIKVDIFLDRGSMEIFVNGGERTLTMNVYPGDPASCGISFFSEGEGSSIAFLELYELRQS